jgi:type I restriction enzyme R subunit
VAQALEHFDCDRYLLLGYVIMPNHVHLLVTPGPTHPLSKILQSWKRFTAREINKARNTSGQVWQRESFDHIVRSVAQLDRFQNYLRENPVNAKLREGEYLLKIPESK